MDQLSKDYSSESEINTSDEDIDITCPRCRENDSECECDECLECGMSYCVCDKCDSDCEGPCCTADECDCFMCTAIILNEKIENELNK